MTIEQFNNNQATRPQPREEKYMENGREFSPKFKAACEVLREVCEAETATHRPIKGDVTPPLNLIERVRMKINFLSDINDREETIDGATGLYWVLLDMDEQLQEALNQLGELFQVGKRGESMSHSLVWERTPPVESGYYWFKSNRHDQPEMLLVIGDTETSPLKVCEMGIEARFLLEEYSATAYWYGPLPMPEPC